MDAFIASIFRSEIKRIGFEDMLIAINSPDSSYLIINTLPINEQSCLIERTIPAYSEEAAINDVLSNTSDKTIIIIIYGRNASDNSVEKKYKQLVGLGLRDVYVYSGGLFEWLLLQDVYGTGQFSTVGNAGDILKYRESPVFNK